MNEKYPASTPEYWLRRLKDGREEWRCLENTLSDLRSELAAFREDKARLEVFIEMIETDAPELPWFENGKWTTHHLFSPPPDYAAGVGSRTYPNFRAAIDAARDAMKGEK